MYIYIHRRQPNQLRPCSSQLLRHGVCAYTKRNMLHAHADVTYKDRAALVVYNIRIPICNIYAICYLRYTIHIQTHNEMNKFIRINMNIYIYIQTHIYISIYLHTVEILNSSALAVASSRATVSARMLKETYNTHMYM